MKATPEQIQEWKDKHVDVFCVSVDDKQCYLKRPDRKALGYASSVGSKDPMRFNEILLNNCWLGGDEEIKTNDSLFLSVAQKIADLIEVKEAEMVKL